jgi:hypothetical protein
MLRSTQVYEIRPRKDRRGVDLISNVLPLGRLSYGEPNAIGNPIGYATLQRIEMMEQNVTIDTLEHIVNRLRCKVSDIFRH